MSPQAALRPADRTLPPTVLQYSGLVDPRPPRDKRSLLHDAHNSLLVFSLGVDMMSDICSVCIAKCTSAGTMPVSHAKLARETLRNLSAGVTVLHDLVTDIHRLEIHDAAPNEHQPFIVQDRLKGLTAAVPGLEAIFGLKIVVTQSVSPACALYSDPDTAKEVTTKLVENAAKAGASRVLIHYLEQEEFVLVTFADDGRGMNPEALRSIGLLAPDQSGPAGGQGTYYIRQLINQAGGTVEWDSREGVGTWVTITLKKVMP